ncbi:MAG: family 20 glycosylhydrolase [Akkermansiaceae bacterium]|nr:family 20 glycosylhydrolase [Akkermansiaceae bacterium]MCF7730634.1 family 20 glycosylhydrolase [Akkermansiaceae bacterium]
MADIVQKKSGDIMGWNEIPGDDLHGFLQDGRTAKAAALDPDTIVHFWKGNPELAKRAIKKGHRIVNSYHIYTCLDYRYGSISLGKAYEFDPVFDGLPPDEEKQIIESGCQMWSERIPTVELMEAQIYPCLAVANEDWENPEVFSVGTEAARATFVPYKTRENAPTSFLPLSEPLFSPSCAPTQKSNLLAIGAG